MDYPTMVEQAVNQFYANGNNEVHTWLLLVQASPEAWTFVWPLLEPSKSWEVQFFAATTLYTKISKQWDEVPKTEYPALKERLLNCIKQSDKPKFILSKLCQALAGFLANSSSTEDNEKETGLVDELVEMLPYNSLPLLELLLRVLSTLPVEFGRRHNLRLINSSYKTTWLLQQVFSRYNPHSESSDSTLYLLGIECALSWLKFNKLPVEASELIYSDLLIAAAHYAPSRDSPEDENAHGWSVVQDCIVLIITHHEIRKRPLTLWEWARSMVTMARQYNGKYFCEILTAMAEAHSRQFLMALVEDGNEERKWTAENLIELLLECSEQNGRYPTEETRSSIPFGFWYTLQDDIGTLDQPFENRALLVLKPIYARLVQALLKKTTLPSSSSEEGDTEQREIFRCYRQDAADAFGYSYRVLGQDLLIYLGHRLTLFLDSPEKWRDIESTLHAFQALGDSVATEESQYIPALMDLILSHIPYDLYPNEILASVCSTMATYAEWIGEHPGTCLEEVLRVVTLGLTRGPTTAPFASMALKDLSRECGPHLAPFAPTILNTIGQTLPNVAPGGGEGSRLMYAAGQILNTLPRVEEQLRYLDATLGLCIVKIRELLKQPLFVARVAVTNYLKMVSTFFSTLEAPIGKTVLQVLLPIFNQIVEHPEWSQDNSTLEAMHVCATRSLYSLVHPEVDARPLLPILVTSYKKWPHPAALDLLSQLVLLFGKDPGNIVGPVLSELSSITLSGIRACRSARGDLSDWSDLLESYLGLLAQICRKNTRLLLQVPEQIPEMLQCGIACLAVPETGLAKAAGNFLSQAIMQSPHLETFIQPIGQELVTVILQCVGGDVPRINLEPHADVLLALTKTCVEWTAQWLRFAFEQKRGKTTTTQAQNENFTRSVLKERRNKRRMCDLVQAFGLLCREQRVGHYVS